MRQLTIGIDLDGVCYDFVGALRDYAHDAKGIPLDTMPDAECWDFFKVQWGWTGAQYQEILRDGVIAGRIFWNGLPSSACITALKRLRAMGHRVVIVTHRSVPGAEFECRAATERWLAVWGIPHDDLVVTGNKTALGLDVLLDDAPHNIEAAEAMGERAIFWTQAWNLHVPHERVFGWRQFERIVRSMSEHDDRPVLIGLSGWAQAGKDTTASYLIDHYGFERVAFADRLKAMLYALNPVLPSGKRVADLVDHCGWEQAKKVPEVRLLLQRLGTEAGRRVLGDTIWTDAALRDLQPGRAYVVTDVRFRNEADAIRSRGGQVWRVVRPGLAPPNDHPSEHDLDDYDFDAVLMNDGTPTDLGAQALLTAYRLVPHEAAAA